jgi:hypothetical protein
MRLRRQTLTAALVFANIAFARTFRPKGKSVSCRRATYWRPLSGAGPSRRLGPGPRYRPIVRDLDVRGAQVALLWLGEWGGGQVRVTAIGGRTRVLGKVPGSGAAAIEYDVFGVSLVPGFAYWAVTQGYEPPETGQLRRRGLAEETEQRALVRISPHTVGFAQDAGVSYYLAPHDEAGCVLSRPCAGSYDLHRRTGLRFGRASPLQLRRARGSAPLD